MSVSLCDAAMAGNLEEVRNSLFSMRNMFFSCFDLETTIFRCWSDLIWERTWIRSTTPGTRNHKHGRDQVPSPRYLVPGICNQSLFRIRFCTLFPLLCTSKTDTSWCFVNFNLFSFFFFVTWLDIGFGTEWWLLLQSDRHLCTVYHVPCTLKTAIWQIR